MMTPFTKPATTHAEQVALLRQRGMIVDDASQAEFYLKHLNYYRLSAYWLTEVQLDELWYFVKKKESSCSPEGIERQCGQTWIWTAIDPPTRLLITFWIGGRCLDDARQMLKDLTSRCQGKPLFVSDELTYYGTVLAELFHKLIPSIPTGKPGRPRNPERVIDTDLDYATVHKTRQGGHVTKVERKVVHGSEQQVLMRLEKSPSQTINTAYIERSNLDWRLWLQT